MGTLQNEQLSQRFECSFASIPFLTDDPRVFRLTPPAGGKPWSDRPNMVRKFQPLADLVEEVNRLIPFHYLDEFDPVSPYPGRSLSALARKDSSGDEPHPNLMIGDWYYPRGASAWSVFRGLVTSSMLKEMLAATGGNTPATFIMECDPDIPNRGDSGPDAYRLESSMYMLSHRCLGESNTFDGLYLVTLVDERYYFQGNPVDLTITSSTSWDDLLTILAADLGIPLTWSAISSAYFQPEADSQLWTRQEEAAVLLDAVAYNLGRTVVRNLDGSYDVLTPEESNNRIVANRGDVRRVVRMAGGEIFQSGTLLPAGDLRKARNAVIPANLNITFPKYVVNDNPVPHFVNDRYRPQRPSCRFEESPGALHTITIPPSSGGSFVSGLTGVSDATIHNTAKALLNQESDTSPLNVSGLASLALRIAQDYYTGQVISALDEVYPGTFAWSPEGIHDIVWSYSPRNRKASTRVLRTEWNLAVKEMQHSTPPVSGLTNTPKGVGGDSVPQTWRDSFSGGVSGTISQTLLQAGQSATFSQVDNFPTQNRWRGKIDDEIILFEGTSGGISGNTVDIVYRGIDGTAAATHGNGSVVSQVFPNVNYGTNLVTSEKGQYFHPSEWTSGGIQGLNLIPQTQTVQCLHDSPAVINARNHYSGAVQLHEPYRPNQSGTFTRQELVWLVERNEKPLQSGRLYDGQFAQYSMSGPASPIYIVNEYLFSGSVQANYLASGAGGGVATVLSGSLTWAAFAQCSLSGIDCSGFIFGKHLASGLIGSGFISSGALNSGNFNIINWPFEICGYQFWCCDSLVLPSADVDSLIVSGPATVYNISGPSSTNIIRGMVPANFNGVKGPQVVGITNPFSGVSFTFYNQASASGFNSIDLPYVFKSGMTLNAYDGAIFWYDTCADNRWKVLATTAQQFGGLAGGGAALASSGFTLNTTAGTYQDTGLSVSLPSAGIYVLLADVRGDLSFSPGVGNAWISCKLFDSTAGADVANSERMVIFEAVATTETQVTASLSWVHTVAVPSTIKLYAKRDGPGGVTFLFSNIRSDAEGRTVLNYLKTGPYPY